MARAPQTEAGYCDEHEWNIANALRFQFEWCFYLFFCLCSRRPCRQRKGLIACENHQLRGFQRSSSLDYPHFKNSGNLIYSIRKMPVRTPSRRLSAHCPALNVSRCFNTAKFESMNLSTQFCMHVSSLLASLPDDMDPEMHFLKHVSVNS